MKIFSWNAALFEVAKEVEVQMLGEMLRIIYEFLEEQFSTERGWHESDPSRKYTGKPLRDQTPLMRRLSCVSHYENPL